MGVLSGLAVRLQEKHWAGWVLHSNSVISVLCLWYF